MLLERRQIRTLSMPSRVIWILTSISRITLDLPVSFPVVVEDNGATTRTRHHHLINAT
jgi:hypothetical protein